MLTVLYANGEGIGRSIPLASRFACEAGGAPAEIALRLKHLDSLNADAGRTAFGFCDDITSGFMEGFCAAYDSEIEDQDRTAFLDSFAASSAEPQRTAFASLREREEAYARAHGRGEVDLSGTARAMFQIDAEDSLRDDFIAALKLFETGKYPDASKAQYEEADARLNFAYRKALSDAEEHKGDYGAVQAEGIRDSERAWLRYRDAWVEFARLRYPSVAAEAWLVLLTNDRASVLDGSFCDIDAMEGPCAQNSDAWKPSPLP